MLRCIDNLFIECIIITAYKPKSPLHSHNHQTPEINPKKSLLKSTSNVPVTVPQFLCRSIAIFYLAEKLFMNFRHILKRASSAILKPKILLMITLLIYKLKQH